MVHHKDPVVPSAHRLSREEVLASLHSGADGLSEAEALERLALYGPNKLRQGKRRSVVAMFGDQFRDPMVLLLMVAAGISAFIGEPQDTIVILVIVVLNSLIGFTQEFRAERAIEALMAMAAPWATVRRGGEVLRIPSQDVVLGDLVLLEAGQIVPADIRLMDVAGLKLDESPLTGESVPVDKDINLVTGEDSALGDRHNMAYKGTTVTYGRGEGVTVATGMTTEMGKIARLLEETVSLKTPLQRRLARVGRNLAVGAVVICAIVFVAGLLRGEDVMIMFLTSVSLAVAAVPEALPAVVTISLALGAKQMVRQNALIRRLPAVETLGSVTYICTDKTGTLTLNRMRVERLVDSGLEAFDHHSLSAGQRPPPSQEGLLLAMALSNDVRLDAEGQPVGDPTEVALYEVAAQMGFVKEELESSYPRVAEIPFSSERQAMTTIHRSPRGDLVAFTKGGFEAVAYSCNGVNITAAEQRHLGLAGDGLRVLAFAARHWPELPEHLDPDNVESDLSFLGLAGALDPPRPEAFEAVATCRQAGIHPVMITGDHPLTARAIAGRLGMLEDGDGDVMTGQELGALGVEGLAEVSGRVRAYARVAPEEKLKLVAALQKKGEAVAMTGDGVNDAPALKQADIGVAMGVNGTDVAKEAADMILLDDNFATIVRAVKEGRKIYDNIRKFFKYTLTSNSGEIWTIFLAPFLGLPIPLLPIHILWINLATDGLPGLALSVEPPEKRVMRRPPRRPNESLFARGMWQHILLVGLLMGGVCLGTQAWAVASGSHWQTMVFTVLCFSQFGHALAIRSEWESLFSPDLRANHALLWTIVFSIAVQLAIIYQPFLQSVFHTQALSGTELALTLSLSTVVFWVVEAEKWLLRRGLLSYAKGGAHVDRNR